MRTCLQLCAIVLLLLPVRSLLGQDLQYLELRAAELASDYESLFVHNASINSEGDLDGDGIGEWDSIACRYSMWGQGLAAKRIRVNKRDYRHRVYGGDSGGRLGRRCAYLSLLYASQSRKGDLSAAKGTLQRLYLTLQAYRRLDMTANRLRHRYLTTCVGEEDCYVGPADGAIRFDGYSGFFVRDDVHWTLQSLAAEVDLPFYLKPNYGAGKLLSVFHELDGVDGCRERDADYVCCWSKLVDLNLFNSQDQLVGIMHGLAYIKQYVPSNATVHLDGVDISIHNIMVNIAEGIYRKTGRCNRYLRVATCDDGCGGGSHGTGSNATAVYKGVAVVAKQVIGDDVDLRFRDHLLWEGGRGFSMRFSDRDNGVFNARLYLLLQLASGLNIDCHSLDIATSIRYITAPLEAYLLHGAYNSCDINLDDAVRVCYDALASLPEGDRLPCSTVEAHETFASIPCTNSRDPYLWYLGGPLEVNNPSFIPYNSDLHAPDEWLFMYELLQAYEHAKSITREGK